MSIFLSCTKRVFIMYINREGVIARPDGRL
jgi:hypothetical protein